jgi:hypothetical protein
MIETAPLQPPRLMFKIVHELQNILFPQFIFVSLSNLTNWALICEMWLLADLLKEVNVTFLLNFPSLLRRTVLLLLITIF